MESREGSPYVSADSHDDFPETTEGGRDSTASASGNTSRALRMKIPKPRIEAVATGKIDIAWDEIEGAKQYEITCTKKMDGKDQKWNFLTTDLHYSINGVDPGYEYQLFVQGDGDKSELTTVISGPSAPTKVKAVADPSSPCDSVYVSFEDLDGHPKSYEVVLADSKGGGDKVERSEKTYATFEGLTPGHAYNVYVRAFHANPYQVSEKELFSRKVYASAEIKTHPGKVIIKPPNYSGNGVARIQWDRTEGATEYHIEWTDGEHDHATRVSSSNEITMRCLAPGKTYSIIVAAKNEAGRGPFSDPADIRTEPPAPAGLKVNHFDRSPHTDLVVSVHEPDVKEKEFIFLAKPLMKNKEERTVPSRSSHALISDLVPGEVYQICAVAKQHGMESKESVHERLIYMYPNQPKNIDGFIKGSCLQVTWDELDVKPTKYQIDIEEDGELLTDYSVTNRLVWKNVKPSASYQIRVAGINNAGRGAFSEDKILYSDPAPPTNPQIKHNSSFPTSSLLVTFDDNDCTPKTYEITAESSRKGEEKEKTIVTKEKSAVFHGLTPGRNYSVKVVAVITDSPEGQIRKSDPVYCVPK